MSRYDGFDKEMNANASRVAVVNQLARQLIHVEHPQAARIQERQAALNEAWSSLREKVQMLQIYSWNKTYRPCHDITCREW